MNPAVPDEIKPRIQLMTTNTEHERILPLLGAHYDSISPETLRERLHLVREDGWRCAARTAGDELLAVVGYWAVPSVSGSKTDSRSPVFISARI